MQLDPPCPIAFDNGMRVVLASDAVPQGQAPRDADADLPRRRGLLRHAGRPRQVQPDAGRSRLVCLPAVEGGGPGRHRHGPLARRPRGQARRRPHGQGRLRLRGRHARQVLGRQPVLHRQRPRQGDGGLHGRPLRQVRRQRRAHAQVLLPHRPDGHRRPERLHAHGPQGARSARLLRLQAEGARRLLRLVAHLRLPRRARRPQAAAGLRRDRQEPQGQHLRLHQLRRGRAGPDDRDGRQPAQAQEPLHRPDLRRGAGPVLHRAAERGRHLLLHVGEGVQRLPDLQEALPGAVRGLAEGPLRLAGETGGGLGGAP